jgi:hypothetical protein
VHEGVVVYSKEHDGLVHPWKTSPRPARTKRGELLDRWTIWTFIDVFFGLIFQRGEYEHQSVRVLLAGRDLFNMETPVSVPMS